MKDGKYYLGIILNIVIPLAEIGLVCVLGPKLLVFFMPFVIGWIIALIANPLVRMLERRLKLVRKHSSALIVVAVLAAVIGLMYFLISRLWYQACDLAKDLPELYAVAAAEVQNVFARFDDLFRMLPANVPAVLAGICRKCRSGTELSGTENSFAYSRGCRQCSNAASAGAG